VVKQTEPFVKQSTVTRDWNFIICEVWHVDVYNQLG